MIEPTDKQRAALKFLDIREEEWQFTTGRYLEARDELEKLRTGVARIAEHLELHDDIPGHKEGVHLFKAVKENERGWNRLCAVILTKIEDIEDEALR